MSPDDPRHGTYAGAVAHWSDSERCCDACRAAASRYRKGVTWDHVNGRRRTVPPHGAVRRLQALQRLGWSMPAIARVTGIDHRVLYAVGRRHTAVLRSTHDAIAAAYEQLSMRLPPETTRNERISAVRARRRAERLGYPPPLAWDDIDDPDAQPSGIRSLTPTRAEILADLDDAEATITQACATLGLSRDTLEKWCERHDLSEVFSRLVRRANPTWAGNQATRRDEVA